MRYCWAHHCKEADDKKTSVSFHAFPKDLRQRQLWIQATGRSCEPGKAAVICSKHFRLDDFERTRKSTRLKPDVIPSQFNDPAALKEEEQTQESESLSGDSTRISRIADVPSHNVVYDSVGTENSMLPQNLNLPNQSNVQELTQGSRKRIWRPVHLKQVTLEHLSSPKKRAKYWSQALDEIEALKKKVKVLQEDKRRMNKKINTLSDMVNHLEDKQSLTENASDTITVTSNTN